MDHDDDETKGGTTVDVTPDDETTFDAIPDSYVEAARQHFTRFGIVFVGPRPGMPVLVQRSDATVCVTNIRGMEPDLVPEWRGVNSVTDLATTVHHLTDIAHNLEHLHGGSHQREVSTEDRVAFATVMLAAHKLSCDNAEDRRVRAKAVSSIPTMVAAVTAVTAGHDVSEAAVLLYTTPPTFTPSCPTNWWLECCVDGRVVGRIAAPVFVWNCFAVAMQATVANKARAWTVAEREDCGW